MPSDVILFWSHGGVPDSIRDRAGVLFNYPIEFVTMPPPPMVKGSDGSLRPDWNGALKQLGPRPVNEIMRRRNIKPQRIAVLGFSASCTSQRMLLDSADGGYIDSAIAIDGIHAGVDVWIDFAELAAFGKAVERGCQPGKRMCVITHSQVEPPYTSTTETAEQIVSGVFGGAVTSEDEPAPLAVTKHLEEPVEIGCKWHPKKYTYDKMPLWYQVNRGGFHVLGYENLDPTGCTDHIFQAQVVLPKVLEYMLAPRWRQPPPSGTCVVASMA